MPCVGHVFSQEKLGEVVLTFMRQEASYQLKPPVRALWGEKTPLPRGSLTGLDLGRKDRVFHTALSQEC